MRWGRAAPHDTTTMYISDKKAIVCAREAAINHHIIFVILRHHYDEINIFFTILTAFSLCNKHLIEFHDKNFDFALISIGSLFLTLPGLS